MTCGLSLGVHARGRRDGRRRLDLYPGAVCSHVTPPPRFPWLGRRRRRSYDRPLRGRQRAAPSGLSQQEIDMSGSRFVGYELRPGDPGAAERFYGSVVGWTAKDAGMGAEMPYTLLSVGE